MWPNTTVMWSGCVLPMYIHVYTCIYMYIHVHCMHCVICTVMLSGVATVLQCGCDFLYTCIYMYCTLYYVLGYTCILSGCDLIRLQ